VTRRWTGKLDNDGTFIDASDEDMCATLTFILSSSDCCGISANLTPLQRYQSRAIANVYDGTTISSPGLLFDDGDTIGGRFLDPRGDVTDSSIDMIRLGVYNNTDTAINMYVHGLADSIPLGLLEPRRQYLVFAYVILASILTSLGLTCSQNKTSQGLSWLRSQHFGLPMAHISSLRSVLALLVALVRLRTKALAVAFMEKAGQCHHWLLLSGVV
jgi:hypothetical protein